MEFQRGQAGPVLLGSLQRNELGAVRRRWFPAESGSCGHHRVRKAERRTYQPARNAVLTALRVLTMFPSKNGDGATRPFVFPQRRLPRRAVLPAHVQATRMRRLLSG